MKNRFGQSRLFAENLEPITEYHGTRLLRTFQSRDQALQYNLRCAMILEQQYEKMSETLSTALKANKHNTDENFKAAMDLTTVEKNLFEFYFAIISQIHPTITDPDERTKMANDWIYDAERIAKRKIAPTARHL